MRNVVFALVLVFAITTAAAQTAQFPNVNVRTNANLNNLIVAGSIATSAQNVSGTSIDPSTGNVFSKSLSADTTFTFANLADGQRWTVILTNGASWTVTWPTVTWMAGSAPVMDVGAGKVNVFSFTRQSGVTFGDVSQNANATLSAIAALVNASGVLQNDGSGGLSWAASSGGGFAGAVSNNVASAGLLAVDATKTNGVAATSEMVQSTLGSVYQSTNASLTTLGTTFTSSTGVLSTYCLLDSVGIGTLGVVGLATSVAVNTTYVYPVRCNLTYTISATSWYVGGTTDAGKFWGIGIYDLAGNRLWYDTCSVTTAGAVSHAATSYTIAPGFYYVSVCSDSATATVYTTAVSTSDKILWNSSQGLKGMGTAANNSTAGVPPATLGTITESTTLTPLPIVKFD